MLIRKPKQYINDTILPEKIEPCPAISVNPEIKEKLKGPDPNNIDQYQHPFIHSTESHDVVCFDHRTQAEVGRTWSSASTITSNTLSTRIPITWSATVRKILLWIDHNRHDQIELDAHIDDGYDGAAQIDHAFDIVGWIGDMRDCIIAADFLDFQNLYAIFLTAEPKRQKFICAPIGCDQWCYCCAYLLFVLVLP